MTTSTAELNYFGFAARDPASTPDAASFGHARERHAQEIGATAPGKVLAILPSKGGAGATFIAANLAHALALEGKRVCLIDLNLYFGEAALYISDSVPKATVADVAAQVERLDATLLESSMLKIAPGFWLLAAADAPERAMDVQAEDIERILAVARANYDFVVLDVSRALDANLIRALDCADQIYLVMQTALPFIRNGGRLLKLFRSLAYPEARVQLLVNRYQKGGDIGLSDIERSLGKKVARTLPNSFGAAAVSINQGRSILDLAPADPLSRALRGMAQALACTRAQPEADGWLWWPLKRRAGNAAA